MSKRERSEAAAILGRVGGKARAKKLTQKERSEIARKGAEATNAKRWGTKKKKKAAKSLDAKREAADDACVARVTAT